MKVLFYIIFFFAFIPVQTCFAQGYDLQAYAAGGEDDVYSLKNLANSKHGCLYTAGTFTGTFTLESQSLITTYPSASYIAKFDYNLNLIWVKKIAESNSSNKIKTQVAIDTNGNVIVGLSFTDKLYFFGDSTVLSGVDGIELLQLDSSASKIWAYNIVGDRLGNKGLHVDKQNNLLVTGDTSHQLFVRKYDNGCNLIWGRIAGGNVNPDYGQFIETDMNGNVFACGLLYPSSSVYFDTLHVTFPIGTYRASFIAKYSSSGIIQWVRYVYSNSFGDYTLFYSIKCLDNGSVVGVGEYADSFLRFSNGFSSLGSHTIGFEQSFITCFDSSGLRTWVKVPPEGSGINGMTELTLNGSSIYVLRGYTNTALNDIDTLVSYGGYDLALERFDYNGNLISFTKLGGTGIDVGNDIIAYNNAIYMVGGTSSIPYNMDADNFSSSFGNSMYVLKIQDNTIGINENVNKPDIFDIYPNPANGEFTLRLPSNKCHIEITDVSGKQVYSTNGNELIKIKLNDLVSGIYIVSVISEDASVSKKLIINR